MRGRVPLSLVVGLVLLALMTAVALLSLVWLPFPTTKLDVIHKLAAPDSTHWLGTDHLGRDIVALLLAGARPSLWVGVASVAIGLCGGVALGAAAAARPGPLDEAVMRLMDFTFAFPALLSAIMLTALAGPGIGNAIVAIGLFNIPVFARVTRASARLAWSRDYVRAAQQMGKSGARVTLDHILPAVLPVLAIQASIQFGTAILAEAALSYLGFGTQPPQPSWGRMLNDAQAYLFQAPRLAVFPGLAIAITVLGANLLGDSLRDWMDPRRRPRAPS